jgi:hypothetical protein
MTAGRLTRASGVSADGSVIVGNGTDPSSNTEPWLARFSTQFGNGLIYARRGGAILRRPVRDGTDRQCRDRQRARNLQRFSDALFADLGGFFGRNVFDYEHLYFLGLTIVEGGRRFSPKDS